MVIHHNQTTYRGGGGGGGGAYMVTLGVSTVHPFVLGGSAWSSTNNFSTNFQKFSLLGEGYIFLKFSSVKIPNQYVRMQVKTVLSILTQTPTPY